MAQPTYKDLLDFLGLQNWQFILLSLLILTLYPIITNLWKLKIVGKIKVNRVKMNGFKCVYISYLGSYTDITNIYSQCIQDFNMVFKFSNHFAIFYDDPSQLPQQNMSKAIIGVCVKEIQNGKMDLFLSKFPQYKRGQFPPCQCLLSMMPLNNLSPIMSVARVYPAIEQKMKELNIRTKYRQIVEIYHENDEETAMSVFHPITEEERFRLWYEPTEYSRVWPKKEE